MHSVSLFKAMMFTLLCSLAYCLASGGVALAADSGARGLSTDDASHLLRRTGFGATPAAITRLAGKSRKEAVAAIMAGLDSQITQTTQAPPAWTTGSAPPHYRFGVMSSSDKQKFRQIRLNEVQSLRRWWINEMVATPNPQAERLVLFWHNHFATAYSALNNQSISLARQHLMLREHASGNFRVLLKQIIRDPAMLNYLDNNGSKKQKPNENLARELLELFTLGEGSYTELDIKNAARALTGYSYTESYDLRFTFKPWLHDEGRKTIFGKQGKFNGDDLIDLILAQPDAARFITAKFWHMLVGEVEKSDRVLNTHADAFRNSDYDIKTLYRSILHSEEFWSHNNRATIIKSPVSLIVGTIRTTGVLPNAWQTLPLQLQRMGQHLFEPPNVAGWPGGAAWITPGRLLSRLEWLERLQSPTPAAAHSDGMNNQSMMSSSMMSAGTQASDMAMQSGPSMSAGISSAMAEQGDASNHLSIRMASEEFDEHVQYNVKVYGQDDAVWDSGTLALKGGHDTKYMGRAVRTDLPWQTINFPVQFNAEDITAIEISFLNDGATPDGADRNLYISRATAGSRMWLPSNGKQTGKCARKKPNQQGNIYCDGTLRMEKSTFTAQADATPIPPGTLRVSDVEIHYVHRANRKPHSDLVFTLSDVELDGRYWNTLNVRYVKHKNGHAVRLNSTECWPECFIQQPACAWENEYSIETASFELEANAQDCMYNGLQAPDKKLARALWSVLDDLYETGKTSNKQKKSGLARNYSEWNTTVEIMQSRLTRSHYNDAIKLEILPREFIDSTLTEELTQPLPAGQTDETRRSSLGRLLELNPGLKLATLLLPTAPAGNISASDANLQEIFTDLSFQLQ